MRKAEPYQPRQPGPGADRGPEIVKGPTQEPLRAALAKELERGEKKTLFPLHTMRVWWKTPWRTPLGSLMILNMREQLLMRWRKKLTLRSQSR